MNSEHHRSSPVKKLLPLTGVVLCIAIWEANSQLGLYEVVAPTLPRSSFPSFFLIMSRLSELIVSSSFLDASATTVSRAASAFAFAIVAGMFFGLLAGRIQTLSALLDIPVEFFRNLPAIAAMPIFILFLGIGTPMKLALCVFGAGFPIFIAARIGVRNVSEDLRVAAQFYGWTGWRLLLLVLLPATLPEIAASSQTALSISLILAIMGEMLIGGDGLGSMIVDAERTFDHVTLYALVLALGLIGSLLALGYRLAIARVVFWKPMIDWHER